MQGKQLDAGTPQTAMAQAYGAAADTPQPTQQAQAAQSAPVGGTGMRGMFGRNRAPLSKESNGRDLNDLTKKLTDYRDKIKDSGLKDIEVKLYPVARGATITANFSNSISMIIMAVNAVGNDDFAYHTLLLASEMNAAPPSRSEQYGYAVDQISAPRTPTTVADEALANVIKAKMRQLIPQGRVFSADWSVVPANFKMADDFAIEDLFGNAFLACWTELTTKQPGFHYESLSGAAGDNTLITSVMFNQDQSNQPTDKFDAAGLPIRAETIIDFRSEQARTIAKDMATENTANVVEFGQVMLATTLLLDPVAARQQMFAAMNGGGIAETQDYVAELTITGFDMKQTIDLSTVLIMISQALPLLDTNTRPWTRSFLPKHLQNNGGGRGGNFRPRDLGALNYDYGFRPQGESLILPFGTNKENEFKLEDFWQLTNLLIQPSAALSIDIPEAGAATWYLRPFAEALSVPQAAAAIIKALDEMTDSGFSTVFNQPNSSRQIFIQKTERVLLGYYLDDHGVAKDLRNIDGLYLMNAKGHDEPDLFKRWSATFGGSNDAQLAARAKLIESVVSNVTYTGIGQHRTFTNDFLVALDRSLHAAGLKTTIDLGRDEQRTMVRNFAGMQQSGALMTNFSSSIASGGRQNVVGGGGYRDMAHIRQY